MSGEESTSCNKAYVFKSKIKPLLINTIALNTNKQLINRYDDLFSIYYCRFLTEESKIFDDWTPDV